jgi:hypothetical protein
MFRRDHDCIHVCTQLEMDQKDILRSCWRRLMDVADEVSQRIARLQVPETSLLLFRCVAVAPVARFVIFAVSGTDADALPLPAPRRVVQVGFKRQLLQDVKGFVSEVVSFRGDYIANGPMAPGIGAQDAIDRLRRYHEELELLERRQNLYHSGQQLFALPRTVFAELDSTRRELGLLDTLYGLYKEVSERESEWGQVLWVDVGSRLESMIREVEVFSLRCKKMPSTVRLVLWLID